MGIKSILLKEVGVKVHVATPVNEANLLQIINECQPDAIVLDAASHIIIPSRLLFLLEDYSQIRLVRISSEDALIEVYDKKKFILKQFFDFITAVVNR